MRQREYKEEYEKKYPEKIQAMLLVAKAVKSGLLVRPKTCSKCGKSKINRLGKLMPIHGHHEDYAKPLEVIWLCAKCHKIHHLNPVLNHR